MLVSPEGLLIIAMLSFIVGLIVGVSMSRPTIR